MYAILQIIKSAYIKEKSSAFDEIWCTAALFGTRWQDFVYSADADADANFCVFGGLLCVDIVTIGSAMVIFAVLTVFWLFLTVFWPLVYESSQVYQNCTNSVPIVKNSQKTVKQQKWLLVYQSSRVYTESAEYTKP